MIVVVMGVAGSGKTAVGSRVAQRLGWPFLDADSLHSPANVAKMAAGVALSDEDREPWLHALREALAAAGTDVVLACSALRDSFRAHLAEGFDDVRFVWLTAPAAVIAERLQHRHGHFFGPELLASQFVALEPPQDALVVDASRPLDEVVQRVVTTLSS